MCPHGTGIEISSQVRPSLFGSDGPAAAVADFVDDALHVLTPFVLPVCVCEWVCMGSIHSENHAFGYELCRVFWTSDLIVCCR